MTHPRIMLAGSGNIGDRYGAELAKALQQSDQEPTIFGVGGKRMREAGVHIFYDISNLDSLGVLESIKGMPLMRRLVQRISEAMDRRKPDVLVQIGMPFLNLRFMELAHANGVPTAYYYTPFGLGISDLKLNRAVKIIDKVLGVTRYETALCQAAGITAEFVGHPLVDLARPTISAEAARDQWQVPKDHKLIAVLPGTREVEVKVILPVVLKALHKVSETVPQLSILVSMSPNVSEDLVTRIISQAKLPDIQVVQDIYNVLHAADLAVVTCGNASLEAALMKVPTLAVQRVKTNAYLLDKMLSRRKRLAIPNILLGEQVIPEIVQSDFTEGRIAEEIKRLLNDTGAQAEMLSKLERLPAELGEPGAIMRAARKVLEMAGAV